MPTKARHSRYNSDSMELTVAGQMGRREIYHRERVGIFIVDEPVIWHRDAVATNRICVAVPPVPNSCFDLVLVRKN